VRACIFTGDLAAVPVRQPQWAQDLRKITGRAIDEFWFVGLRQTQPLADGTRAFQPHCDEHSRAVRVANVAFRLAGAHLAPRAAVRWALDVAGSSIAEAIAACDPDVVLLDAVWGDQLKPLVEKVVAAPVHVTGGTPSRSARPLTLGPVDHSALVSIVLPTHNGSRYLKQSIVSCLEQTYPTLEVIVVDDGSREDIRAIVDSCGDSRVRYIRHERNRGLPAALNTGFLHATGRYLTWTSDDNYYVPSAIERLTRALQRNPQLGFVYASMFIVDEIGDARSQMQRALPPSELMRQNVVGGCFMYTRQVYESIGEYDSGATLVEDYDYWVRISKRFPMQRILDPLYYYRYHQQSLTSKHTREDVARRFDVVRQQNGVPVG